MYEWSRHLATILLPLTGQSSRYSHNAATFCDEIKRFTIEDTEMMVSYDVVSLYTKVPIQRALEIIQQKLDNDGESIRRTQQTLLSCAHCV